jgi:hypothetical protein
LIDIVNTLHLERNKGGYMLTLCYSGKSAPSAQAIADQDGDIEAVRGAHGHINWGRYRADTELNPDISNVTNKRVMRELFAEHNVPMPKLYSIDEAIYAVPRGTTLVGRPDHHTKGRGFWLCTTTTELDKALRGTRKKAAATHFMEYVKADHEYRVHIFKGKSIRISEKSFFIGEDGKRDYTTVKPTGNIKHIRKAAKKALEAVGLDFGAVDILANDTECWVLEVNAAPGLGGTMPRLYAEVFRKWHKGEF